MDLRTIPNVELARVGLYDLASGPYDFGRDDLASAIANASRGTQPRIKLGHVDPRFDGEPAIGVVTNMRLAEDGDVLLGDLANVPGWLADALPASYPGRSIEATVHRDEGLRVTGLALLGMTRPGIDSLADLEFALAAAARDRPDDADVQYLAIAITQLRAAEALETGTAQERSTIPTQEEERMTLHERLRALGLPENVTEDQITDALAEEPVAIDETPVAASEDANAAQIANAAALLRTQATPIMPVAEPVAAAAAPAAPDAATPGAPREGTVLIDAAGFAELQADLATRREVERETVFATALEEGRFAPSRRQHYEAAWAADPEGTRHLLTAAAADGGLAPNTVPVKERGTSTTASTTNDSLNRVLASIPGRKKAA